MSAQHTPKAFDTAYPGSEATFDYEVPADFNPVAAELAGLNKQLEEVNREFAAKVRRINEQIAKLEAIEYTPEAKS